MLLLWNYQVGKPGWRRLAVSYTKQVPFKLSLKWNDLSPELWDKTNRKGKIYSTMLSTCSILRRMYTIIQLNPSKASSLQKQGLLFPLYRNKGVESERLLCPRGSEASWMHEVVAKPYNCSKKRNKVAKGPAGGTQSPCWRTYVIMLQLAWKGKWVFIVLSHVMF